MTEFIDAEKEFLPMAKTIYELHKDDLHLTVEPSFIMFLRSDSRRKAFAYAKRVCDEYTLMTEKKFFIVIINKYFNLLKTERQKAYVILHEMMHLNLNENERFRLIDHNLKEFKELLKNPEWNLELLTDVETIMDTDKDTESKTKIGIDFDFNNKEAVQELNRKIKEEKKVEKNEPDEFGSPQDDDSRERPDLERKE